MTDGSYKARRSCDRLSFSRTPLCGEWILHGAVGELLSVGASLRACVTVVFGGKEKEVIAELTVRCLHRCFGSGDECVVTVYDVRQVSGKYNSDFGVSDQ